MRPVIIFCLLTAGCVFAPVPNRTLRMEEYDTVRTINMAPNAAVDTLRPLCSAGRDSEAL